VGNSGNQRTVLEIHSKASPSADSLVDVLRSFVEVIVFSTYHNLGILSAEVVVETQVNAVVFIAVSSAESSQASDSTSTACVAGVQLDALIATCMSVLVAEDSFEFVLDEVVRGKEDKSVEVTFTGSGGFCSVVAVDHIGEEVEATLLVRRAQ